MERRKFIRNSAIALPIAFGLQNFAAQELFANSYWENKPEDVLQMSISAKSKGKRLDHYWSKCVGAGRANEGLRANWLEHLSLVHKDCCFQYLRFHGLFHDDTFVYHEENGKQVYNWQYIDELFDRMLAIGVRPFVELGFFPKDISSAATCFWWGGHGTPPSDFSK